MKYLKSYADAAHMTEADYVEMVSDNNVANKLQKAGLHTTMSEYVDAPIIEENPLTPECSLAEVNEDGNATGRIVNVSADIRILDANGRIDPAKFQAIAFDPANNAYLRLREKAGNSFRDGKKLNRAKQATMLLVKISARPFQK